MSLGPGFWYGVAVDVILFGGIFLVSHMMERRGGRRSPKRGLSGPSDFGRLKGRMERAARPTLLLTPARTPGFSKLGGEPDLPHGLSWPVCDGRPMTFVAQLDLGALSGVGLDWLPSSGHLFAFVDIERYGFAEQVCVLYSSESSRRSRAPVPPGVKRLNERRVAFEFCGSIPSLDWLGMETAEAHLDRTELDELAELPDRPFGDGLQHRIGGYPSEIQNGCLRIECEHLARRLPEPDYEIPVAPAIDRASRQWRLLLQIDSDPDLGTHFGDNGRLYVFIRERHARAGDFSKTVTIFQCY
jgi:hypothetical protein